VKAWWPRAAGVMRTISRYERPGGVGLPGYAHEMDVPVEWFQGAFRIVPSRVAVCVARPHSRINIQGGHPFASRGAPQRCKLRHRAAALLRARTSVISTKAKSWRSI